MKDNNSFIESRSSLKNRKNKFLLIGIITELILLYFLSLILTEEYTEPLQILFKPVLVLAAILCAVVLIKRINTASKIPN